jgi:hypothetical protein
MTTRRGFLVALTGAAALLKLGVRAQAALPSLPPSDPATGIGYLAERQGAHGLRNLIDDGTFEGTIHGRASFDQLEAELLRTFRSDPVCYPLDTVWDKLK